MGAGCSYAGKTAEALQGTDCPPRPAYGACDLVGPPVIDDIFIGPVDVLLRQSAQFAETVCSLNDSLNGLLLDARLATGLLQGGFSLKIDPSPNVDIFTFELLTSSGRPLGVVEAARLRGQDLTRGGKLSALDAQLTKCLEDLAELFIRRVGVEGTILSLSSEGTLVSRNPGQPTDPVVDVFNRTMLDMRSALGADYILALHLHKAQAHGVPAFHVRLLKPAPDTQTGPTPLGAGTLPVRTASPVPGFLTATLLDQAACLNASRLADALHAFQDANCRLATALDQTGLRHHPLAVLPCSPRSVYLAGTSPGHSTASDPHPGSKRAAPEGTERGSSSRRRRGNKSSGPRGATSLAAAAVRALPAASRLRVARAVEGFNAAVHSLAHTAASAPGPASFAALLTHVLGELRDVVATAAGESALEEYQPTVYFSGGPDHLPTLEFQLEAQLGGPSGAVNGGGWSWARPPPPFPDCLSPQVRRAWLLLGELLRVHNSAVAQLDSLRQLAAAFDEGLRRRSSTLSHDAIIARMSRTEAGEAGRALLRNHMELRDCWQGALQALTSTLLLVRDEMAEAAQLARVQCSFMSPTAWSISIASTATATTFPSSGATASSLSSTRALCTSVAPSSSAPVSGSNRDAAALDSSRGEAMVGDGKIDSQGGGNSPTTLWPALNLGDGNCGNGVSTSMRSCGGSSVAKTQQSDRYAAASTENINALLHQGSPPDVDCLYGQRQLPGQRVLPSFARGASSPLRPRASCASSTASASVVADVSAVAGDGDESQRRDVAGGSRRMAARGGGTTGGRSIHRYDTESTSRSLGRPASDAGWVPLEGLAQSMDDGIASQSQSPVRTQRPGVQSHVNATASPTAVIAVAVAGTPGGGRVGGDSLADEYARTALSHLHLQDL